MNQENPPAPFREPSVWDLVVSRLRFWDHTDQPEMEPVRSSVPWLALGAVALSLIAQLTLEPSPARTPWPAIALYFGALICLVGAVLRHEWSLAPGKPDSDTTLRTTVRIEQMTAGLVLALLAFVFFGSGRFQWLNLLFWIAALVFVYMALREKDFSLGDGATRVMAGLRKKSWRITITRWTLVVLAVLVVILFFNFYRLDSVPPEMVSDQAEKLLDINDILHGKFSVYFPRNTGREVLHFYLTAGYMALFNLDVSFLNLKVVAVFANLVTLLFIFLLGKEVGNRWVGLAAVFFAGIAYWPLVFTRLALRIPYYPLFTAPVLYFLIRGLRRQNIVDLFLTGLFLGLGLHGYTPFRIVPLLVVVGVGIYLVHRQARGKRWQVIFGLAIIVVVSLIVFLPLLRYWIANPELFAYRAFSRLTPMEAGFNTSPVVIFIQNFWKASLMFFWDNGSIWAHSIPGRPALEVVSGALYFLGVVSLLIRYIRRRHWVDLLLLISIPILLLPSILSLAYPGENPSLNRTAGAVVPVFVMIGLASESVVRSIGQRLKGRSAKVLLTAGVALMLVWSGVNNYDLVFRQYEQIYTASSWNTSELGRIARFFIDSLGSPDTTYVVGYPHWVDSRLVAINAGYPDIDFAIFPEQIPATRSDPRAKLFFLNTNDNSSRQILTDIYPNGILNYHQSSVAGKDFWVFFVADSEGGAQ